MSPASPVPLQPEAVSHEDVLRGLERSGLLQDCQLLWLSSGTEGGGSPSAECTLSGTLSLGLHVIQLRVRLPVKFPHCLPEIRVERIDPPESLPHMLVGGVVCFPEDADLLYTDDPQTLAWEALVYAKRLLSDMLTGHRGEEYTQEAVAYWRGLAGRRQMESVVSGGAHPRPLVVFFRGDLPCAVADDPDTYASSRPERTLDGLTQGKALYVPLGSAEVERDFHPQELSTLQGLRKHVRALPEDARFRLRLLIVPGTRELLLVLGLRRPRGERALLGLLLTDIQGGHPLEDERSQARCVPIELLRKDLNYLAPRGGAGPALRDRRILLAGCGAVGGYIAQALARAGVGKLSLVDPDVFTLDNTYRHACGMSWLHHPKVEGLREEIQRAIPYVSVSIYLERIEELLARESSFLREHDLVISAMGHPTVERQLNQRIWTDSTHPPALFTWLEPLGLGGHALLTHLGGTRGCMSCIYHQYVKGGPLENSAAFAMPGLAYTRDALGCGSRYLPFADLDAQRTAGLATRLALRVLRGELAEAHLMSWKGARQAFDQAGYHVTSRYDMEPDRMELATSAYHREGCPVCGPG